MRRNKLLAAFGLLVTGVICAQPTVDSGGVLNAANYTPAIAQGSMFVVFGNNMGPAKLAQVSAFPIPTMLAGTSVRITTGAQTKNALLVYTSAPQVAAILPSDTNMGPATLTVTYNGQTSAPASFNVVRDNFGAFTNNSAGTGAAVIQNFNSQIDLGRNGPTESANPGQIVILWGTGLGPISGSDAGAPPVGDIATEVQLTVGGKPARVTYKGRSGCCSGIDQIVFEVPQGVEGCSVPISIAGGSTTANLTMSIAASGKTCVNAAVDACSVKQFQPSPQGGLTVWSPDGKQYLVNKEDSDGTAQIYVGQRGGGTPVCITCSDKTNGPKAKKFKMQPNWHPSGRWIVLAVEQDSFSKPWFATPQMIEGWLQSGLWVDIYATTPDGSAWFKLQDFGQSSKAFGFTGVAFTPNGEKGVWAQIVDGNIFAYNFGKWELILADFQEVNGVPSFTNLRNITPPDTYWVEPANFSPNGKDLVLTADHGFADHAKVEGQDQYILDIDSGRITNLTKSPNIWDEHGVFSPDGEKILFMSSYPYRSDPRFSTIWFLKTEFMMMDKDGSNLRQISHFNQPGYPEFSSTGSVAAGGIWSLDGTSISALNLFFPKYKSWEIRFEGNCGKK